MTTALELRRKEAAMQARARRERLRQSRVAGVMYGSLGALAGGALFSKTDVAGVGGAVNYAAGTVGLVMAATGRGRAGGAADALTHGLIGMGQGQLAMLGQEMFGGQLLGESLFGSLFED